MNGFALIDGIRRRSVCFRFPLADTKSRENSLLYYVMNIHKQETCNVVL